MNQSPQDAKASTRPEISRDSIDERDALFRQALEVISKAPDIGPDPHDERFKRMIARERVSELTRRIGKRYSNCSLESFELSDVPASREKQMSAICFLRNFAAEMPRHVEDGKGLFIFGPVGTGKDHLLSAMMLHAARQGLEVLWVNGEDLYGSFRDAISDETNERQLLEPYVNAPILAISDPLPTSMESLTPFQKSMLFRIIDRRYRSMRPVWVTVNASGQTDSADRFGVPLLDRLKDGSLCVPCNWLSYRKAGKFDG